LEMVTGSLQNEQLSQQVLPGLEPLPMSNTRVGIPRNLWLPGSILALLLIALYYRVAIKLVVDWYNIPDYSHGFLVPLFSIFLIWDNRRKIAATPIRPSWAGLPVVVLGLLILIFGVYGVDLFTSRVSFVLLLSGLIWTFLGRAMLRQLRFPVLVLLLAIPFPAIIFNQITFPLQLLASKLASSILPLLGVPTLQEGNVIQLPVMKLEVAEACSGIRSLMSLFTLAVFYGYFLEKTTRRRLILALASIPIAVAANAIRIVGTGLCVQYWDPTKALGFFHEFSGWVMFVISLGCLYLIHRIMRIVAPPREGATA
ncbi:MAG TPA: exosortase A, partial [Edaphobacter sp.]|nr:exosortase A [Edaphobacter sp.]